MQSRRKEIILLALALGALAVALYTFWGKPRGTAASAPDAVVRAEEAGQEVATAPEESAAPEEEPAGEVTTPDTDRNPFSAPEAPASGPSPEDAETGEPPPGPLLAEQQPLKTELRLVGIVTGARTLAVIRHGDTRYYVKVGDEIADGYRVEAIRGDREVVLAGSKGTIVLRTGKPS